MAIPLPWRTPSKDQSPSYTDPSSRLRGDFASRGTLSSISSYVNGFRLASIPVVALESYLLALVVGVAHSDLIFFLDVVPRIAF